MVAALHRSTQRCLARPFSKTTYPYPRQTTASHHRMEHPKHALLAHRCAQLRVVNVLTVREACSQQACFQHKGVALDIALDGGYPFAADGSAAARKDVFTEGCINASLCRSGAYVATRAAGRAPMRGLARPSTEVVNACSANCMWVWGFQFGFALRCAALPCAVYVRLLGSSQTVWVWAYGMIIRIRFIPYDY
jgi:hypothetical protein